MARCNFWDCSEDASGGGDLCDQHGPQFKAGLIDYCPDCQLHKSSGDELCGDCSRWDKFSGPEDGFDIFDDGEYDEIGGADDWERSLAEYAGDDDYEN